MSYTVAIDHEVLIDALEEKLGAVYEHIKEGDKVEKVRIGYRQVFITIGEDDGAEDDGAEAVEGKGTPLDLFPLAEQATKGEPKEMQ